MAEDVRAVLPQLHQEHSEQHGLEAAAVAEYDFHLERSVLFITLVGEVRIWNFTLLRLPFPRNCGINNKVTGTRAKLYYNGCLREPLESRH